MLKIFTCMGGGEGLKNFNRPPLPPSKNFDRTQVGRNHETSHVPGHVAIKRLKNVYNEELCVMLSISIIHDLKHFEKYNKHQVMQNRCGIL